jgi:hypothetical protein
VIFLARASADVIRDMTATKRISARLPADLVKQINADAKAQERDFTKQLTHVLRTSMAPDKNLNSHGAPPPNALKPTPAKGYMRTQLTSLGRGPEPSTPPDAAPSLRDGAK